MKIRSCAGCGARLTPTARFCGDCGRPAPRRASSAEVRAELRADRRHANALITVFVGALVALAVGASQETEGAALLAGAGVDILIGFAGIAVLAHGVSLPAVLRGSLAGPPTLQDLALAPAVGFATAVVAHGWVLALRMLAGVDADAGPDPATPLVAILVVSLVPLVEEWLCRGVLWRAAEPLAGGTATVWITAALFALLHGLNGAFVLELPHRFVGGLALGWLRLRSGSLAPPILAHAVWNLAVTAID